ncbi:MAG: IS3 family transposase [Gemmatimonadetes bacterium]|nr:IS3 family transposase [Gemmatimonadota bacterium]
MRRGCQLMNLSRSSYYYRPKACGKDDEALIARIEAICAEFPRYGYRRVTAQLRHEGRRVNHKRVARIMRERNLSVKLRRQAVRTSDGGCREAVFPNLARDFVPRGPNQLWVGDISFIRTRLAFVFLAVILDAWSRRVIGYAVSRQIDTRLTIAALQAALEDRRPPRGCLHHTDRGSQYPRRPTAR